MRASLTGLGLSVVAGVAICLAHTASPNPPSAEAEARKADYTAVYCSGFLSSTKLPYDTYLISGEQSNYKITFASGDYVYINRGQDKDVKVGDRYMVARPITDPLAVEWFKGQNKLFKAMGMLYQDAGHLRVVNVQPKVSIAQVVFSCDYMQRGDVVRPFEERPQPPFKSSAAFDHFAPVSGKPVGTIVESRDFADTVGRGNTMYINLGASQGVNVGDYVRVFRYQGTMAEMAPQTKDYQYQIYGFGSTPVRYSWKDLPREVLGEGIVINVSKNASTVFITFSSIEMFVGDYVEIE